MGNREDTTTLNQITIQEVGHFLGLMLPLHGMTRCPFPDHEDKTPSFEVKKSRVYWICYGCQRHGGSIDFVKVHFGIGFMEAKVWLADHASLSATPVRRLRRPTQVVSRPLSHSIPSPEPIESPPDCELYEALLQHAPLQKSGLQYLLNRGLSKEVVSTFHIGQLPEQSHFIVNLIRNFGYQRLENAGLLTK